MTTARRQPLRPAHQGLPDRGGRLGAVLISLGVLVAGAVPAGAGEKLPAFPGAEGFGCETPGGRGGKVIHVTNLKADGPGSLQAACSAEGPRIVVFDVSGVIPGSVAIDHSNITIAGQTAPGGGVTIEGALTAEKVNDVVVRFLRVRPKTYKEMHQDWRAHDAIHFIHCRRVVFDHVSVSWGTDEVIGITYCRDWTIQWCTIEESAVPEHGHNYGLLAGYEPTYATLHHNLWAHHVRRCPGMRQGPADIRNNVVYNNSYPIVHEGGKATGGYNVVKNYYQRGPDSLRTGFGGFVAKAEYYVQGNLRDDGTEVRQTKGKVLTTPVEAPQVTTHDPREAYKRVLASAGAFPRDPVTRRTIREVRTRGGRWGRREPKGGLMAGLKPMRPPNDSDRDGMPDAWETRHGLDPQTDDSATRMRSGYTAIEEYVNGRAAELLAAAQRAEKDRRKAQAAADAKAAAEKPKPKPPAPQALHPESRGWKLQFADDFQRGKNELGKWEPLFGKWIIQDGWLTAAEHTVCKTFEIRCKRPFGGSVRLEYDARAVPDAVPCDLSAALATDLSSPTAAAGRRWDNKGSHTGYFFGFGANHNGWSKLGRNGEQVAKYDGRMEVGKVHHVICQRDGKKLLHIVDGQILYEGKDEKPLTGEGHRGVLLYTWGSPAQFDNVKVYTKP